MSVPLSPTLPRNALVVVVVVVAVVVQSPVSHPQQCLGRWKSGCSHCLIGPSDGVGRGAGLGGTTGPCGRILGRKSLRRFALSRLVACTVGCCCAARSTKTCSESSAGSSQLTIYESKRTGDGASQPASHPKGGASQPTSVHEAAHLRPPPLMRPLVRLLVKPFMRPLKKWPLVLFVLFILFRVLVVLLYM